MSAVHVGQRPRSPPRRVPRRSTRARMCWLRPHRSPAAPQGTRAVSSPGAGCVRNGVRRERRVARSRRRIIHMKGESHAAGDAPSLVDINGPRQPFQSTTFFEDPGGEGSLSCAAMPACEVGDGAHRRLVPVSDAVCIEPRVDSTRCAAHGGRASNLAPAQGPVASAVCRPQCCSGQRGLPAAVLLPVVMVVVVGILLPEATVRFRARAPCLCLGLSCCASSLIFPVCCRCGYLLHRVSDRARRARRQLE